MRNVIIRVSRIGLAGVVGATVLVVFTEAMRAAVGVSASPIVSANAQQPSINGNCNNIGNNNINCNTFNFGSTRLTLTDSLKEQLISHMPNRDKVVHVNAVGASSADQAVIKDVISFLKSNSYNVSFDSLTGMRIPSPDHKISFAERSDGYYLEIAPSAN